ncbi:MULTISPECIES: hypothetical protein [unclassified Caballeronia]|uniref:hypothetical protein n=1 Tax=unclassified Caballeronia TaxID=2646786 RepID=UPI002028DD8D|nr:MULTISPECIES: hypothetical protein [unclassified Caballeronia]
MPDIRSAWLYADSVSEQRQITLAALGSFENLVALAKDEIVHVRVRACQGRESGLTQCIQPIFSFELPNAGDPLFNGPYGYRAQYWQSPLDGLKANAALIAALTPKLLAVVDIDVEPQLAKINVCSSLRATSAKFWMQEIPSLLLSPTHDLNVKRWCDEAQQGIHLAQWGLSAPEVQKFEIKGALIDPYGNEVVPTRKIFRHFDIHHYGFS